MVNLILAIAMWCGPLPDHQDNRIDINRAQEIYECRQELFTCVGKEPAGTGFLNCFKETKRHAT